MKKNNFVALMLSAAIAFSSVLFPNTIPVQVQAAELDEDTVSDEELQKLLEELEKILAGESDDEEEIEEDEEIEWDEAIGEDLNTDDEVKDTQDTDEDEDIDDFYQYLTIADSDILLKTGKSKVLKVEEAIGPIKWTSNHKNIVSVTSSGKVKAVKPGAAVITATDTKTGNSASCEVKVYKKYSQKEIKKRILKLKNKYPEGKHWTNKDSYYWAANNIQCYGCIAFVAIASDYAFGMYAPVTTHKSFSKIKVGDHIRIGNVHSVIVLEKSDNAVKVAEGNYNASIRWGRTISKASLKASGFYVDTRW